MREVVSTETNFITVGSWNVHDWKIESLKYRTSSSCSDRVIISEEFIICQVLIDTVTIKLRLRDTRKAYICLYGGKNETE